ncbi:MAG TPA: PQQ-binding-like beta-propeller repeat protein [Planctomycetota bacterium]|nr:PQQ-binding-like beta-propeller repeat protein [Planctomycetota bacterium]
MQAHRAHATLLLLALASCAAAPQESAAWPQGAGPNGNWTAAGPAPPLHFSATTGTNVLWRTPLPEVGQGGIAIAAGRVFVATMAPWRGEGLTAEDAARYAHATEARKVVGKHIDALCLDAATGALLWTRRIEGEVPSIYGYPFSDATSASPVASADHVWFTNAGGQVACFTHGGDVVWRRRFQPTSDGPFNKQFEPFLLDDPARGAGARTFVHMEPFASPTGARWHLLVGLDALTGAELWRSTDALTHYNAPILVATPEGPCVLHARGGPHDVPERPVGVSLTRVTGKQAGTAVWRYDDPRGNHEASLQTMACDDRYVYWLLREPRNALVLLDRSTGRELREVSLVHGVTVTAFDEQAGTWRTRTGVDLDKGVFPARYSLHAANGFVFFQCYATAWGKPVLAPPYSFARIDPGDDAASAQVAYLEVPTGLVREPDGATTFVWRTPQHALVKNSRGEEVSGDERSRWDGWDWVFNGSPTRVDDWLYYTLASGLVYVLDAGPRPFDGSAFLALDDLGAAGETWTANSVSYAAGRLFHRTAAELLCLGSAAGAAPPR